MYQNSRESLWRRKHSYFPRDKKAVKIPHKCVISMVSSCRLGINWSENRCGGWGAQGRNLVAIPNKCGQTAGMPVGKTGVLCSTVLLLFPSVNFICKLPRSETTWLLAVPPLSLRHQKLPSPKNGKDCSMWQRMWHEVQHSALLPLTVHGHAQTRPSPGSSPNKPCFEKHWMPEWFNCRSSAWFEADLRSDLWHHLCAVSLRGAFWRMAAVRCCALVSQAKGRLCLWAGSCQPAVPVLCRGRGADKPPRCAVARTFPLLQRLVAQMSLSQKPIVQLEPKCSNHVPVPRAAVISYRYWCTGWIGAERISKPSYLLYRHSTVLYQDLSSTSLIFSQLKSPVLTF